MVKGNGSAYALEVKGIHKSFFSNHVLKGVSLKIKQGEVLGLIGSNGAGKSTLMKIVNGVYTLDKGEISLNGRPVQFKDANDAKSSGIGMVYQEFSLIPTMTVAQNIYLGSEPKKNGLIDDKACVQGVMNACKDFGVDINPNVLVEDLSIGNQQIVEIIKALMNKPTLLILDEPTASLTHKEIDLLFAFMNRLRKQNIAILLISHHMQEIMQICDRAVVLRNGQVELDSDVKETSVPELVEAMIGRKLASHEFLPPKNPIDRSQPILTVKDLSWANRVTNVTFDVFPGEVVGLAGLLGSGRTEILKSIYGLLKPKSGLIHLDGKEIKYAKPWESIEQGLFLVPENRRESGIVGIHTIEENMHMSNWRNMCKGIFINESATAESAIDMQNKLKLKCTGIDQLVESLSGGNQQKVVFAKSMLTNPSVLLLDEPTVGIDIEAKGEIASIIRNISNQGNGVIMVTSELDEMERLCDRVLILKEGKIINTLSRDKGDLITEKILSEAIQCE